MSTTAKSGSCPPRRGSRVWPSSALGPEIRGLGPTQQDVWAETHPPVRYTPKEAPTPGCTEGVLLPARSSCCKCSAVRSPSTTGRVAQTLGRVGTPPRKISAAPARTTSPWVDADGYPLRQELHARDGHVDRAGRAGELPLHADHLIGVGGRPAGEARQGTRHRRRPECGR